MTATLRTSPWVNKTGVRRRRAENRNGHASWNADNAHPERIGANKSAFQRVRCGLQSKTAQALASQAQAAIKKEAEILKCREPTAWRTHALPAPPGRRGAIIELLCAITHLWCPSSCSGAWKRLYWP